MSETRPTDPSPDDGDRREAQEGYDVFVKRALEHHARTGEWLPDPLLDEVAEMRRKIMAEHDNDYDKVLDWYVELGKQRPKKNGRARHMGDQDGSSEKPGVSAQASGG